MVNNDRILYSFIDDFLNIPVLSKTAMPAISLKSCRKTSLQEDFNVQGGDYTKAAAGKYIGTANITNKLVLYL